MIRRKERGISVRFVQFAADVNDSFWLRPALCVLSAIVLAETALELDRRSLLPSGFVANWLYTGGETGARTLLGAVAGSTIAVAGTLFSITIATLTLASNQMGPRLLRNFTRDRGNQATLGAFLGTFAYALLALRAVGGAEETFVPHLATTVAILLALGCVAMLIFFVHRVASRINSETVIELVYRDLQIELMSQTTEQAPAAAIPDLSWSSGTAVTAADSGFIQQLDERAIADWACDRDATVRLCVRMGDFVFPGAPIGMIVPSERDGGEAVRDAIALGATPTASGDIEFAVTQLVDIASRALSPGINDPNTAIRVLDRLGAALCLIVSRHLPSGIVYRNGRAVLCRTRTTYAGLTDAMFHPVRQHAPGSAAVLIRMLEVLTKVAQCERRSERLEELARHGRLVLADACRCIGNSADLAELRGRFGLLIRTITIAQDGGGPLATMLEAQAPQTAIVQAG